MSKRLDALLGKKFNAPKCKTLLKLTVGRLKVLRNKRENGLKQMQTEVAKLLEKGQENSALIKVENVWREKNILLAYDILDQYCELVTNRLTIIEAQKKGSCPEEVKEAIASMMYAASQCADLVELKKIQNQFSLKYGKEFTVAAIEMRPDCGVNLDLVHNLSVQIPKLEVKLSLLKEIAVEHNVAWDAPKAQEQAPKELLVGPNKLSSSSKKVQHIGSVQVNSLSADTPMTREGSIKVSRLDSTMGVLRSCSPSSLSEDTPTTRVSSVKGGRSGSNRDNEERQKTPYSLSPSEGTPMAREASIKRFLPGSGFPSSLSYFGDTPMAREALVKEFHSGSNRDNEEREKAPPPEARQGERRDDGHLENKSGKGISSSGKVESPSYSTEEHSIAEEVECGEYRDIAHAAKAASELAARAAVAARKALALAEESNRTSGFMAESVSPQDLDSRVHQSSPESHPLMKPRTERASSPTLSSLTSPERGDASEHLNKEPSWKNCDHQDPKSTEEDTDFNAPPLKFDDYEDNEYVGVEKIPDTMYPSRQNEKDPFGRESREEGSKWMNISDGSVNVEVGIAPSQMQKTQFDDYYLESDKNVLNLNNKNVASSPINSEEDEFEHSLGRHLSETTIASKPHLPSLVLRSSDSGFSHRHQNEFSLQEAEEEKELFYKKSLRSPRQLGNLFWTNSPFTDSKFRGDSATYDDYMSSEEPTKKHSSSYSSRDEQYEDNTNMGLSFRVIAPIGDEDDHSDLDKDTRNRSGTIFKGNMDSDEIGYTSPLPPYVDKDSDSDETPGGKGQSRAYHLHDHEYDSQWKPHHSRISFKATPNVRMRSPRSPKLIRSPWHSSNDDNSDCSDAEENKLRKSTNTRQKQKGGGGVYSENEMEADTNAKKDQYSVYNSPWNHRESYPPLSPSSTSVRSYRSKSPRKPPSPRSFPDMLISPRQPPIANTTTKGAFSTTHGESTSKLKWQSRASDLDEDNSNTQNESKIPNTRYRGRS